MSATTATSAEAAALGRDDVIRAANRLAGATVRTPTITLHHPSVSMPIAAKLEHHQTSGSFKFRGALHALLTDGTDRPVVAASGGNHGIAVAAAAARLGRPATIFVPTTVDPAKADAIAVHNPDLRRCGDRYADAAHAALAFKNETGAQEVHPYDDPVVCAGAGTVALELAEDTASCGGSDTSVTDTCAIDTVLVACGGGGLVAGMAAYLEDRVRVVAVESYLTTALHAALAAGEPTVVDVGGVVGNSLGAARVGDICFEMARRYQMGSVLVADEDIDAARTALWRHHRLAVEHAAAAPLAALVTGAYQPDDGERVAVILCGANTDSATLETGVAS